MAGRLPEQNSQIAAEATVAADLLQPALQDLQQLHLVLQAPPPRRAAEKPTGGTSHSAAGSRRQKVPKHARQAELVLRMRGSGAAPPPLPPLVASSRFPEKMSLIVVPPELRFQRCHLQDRTSGKVTYTRVSQVKFSPLGTSVSSSKVIASDDSKNPF